MSDEPIYCSRCEPLAERLEAWLNEAIKERDDCLETSANLQWALQDHRERLADALAEVERLRARPYWNGTDAMSPGWEAALAEVERLQSDLLEITLAYGQCAKSANEADATIQRVRDLPRIYGGSESLERFVRVSDLDAALDR